jgi:FKBP-type peptidyl-prolyl cis-trans isomerase SlyD
MVVYVDVTVTDENSQVLESSIGNGPLIYLHGAKNVIPGLERVLEGRKAGDLFDVTLEPVETFGVFDSGKVRDVPLSALQGVDRVKAGMAFIAEDAEGTDRVFVLRVHRDMATVDGNHPLAGRRLTFSGTVIEVRKATSKELDKGRAF